VLGLLTYTKEYRNFNVYVKDATGTSFSISSISSYNLTEKEYSEKNIYYMVNDEGGGKGVTYDLSSSTATSATRSVPEECLSLVSTHSAPACLAADATDSSSVATTTASAMFIWEILCQTRTIRGSPERRRRGLRGRRRAPRRAGMTTSVPIYPPVFARHDAKVTLSNIPTVD